MARMKIEHMAAPKGPEGLTVRDRMVAHLPRYRRWLARMQPLAA
jgi:hypothetical protein